MSKTERIDLKVGQVGVMRAYAYLFRVAANTPPIPCISTAEDALEWLAARAAGDMHRLMPDYEIFAIMVSPRTYKAVEKAEQAAFNERGMSHFVARDPSLFSDWMRRVPGAARREIDHSISHLFLL